jgi:hypothetical protein
MMMMMVVVISQAVGGNEYACSRLIFVPRNMSFCSYLIVPFYSI